MIDVIELTKKLIKYNTINPPGNERPAAEFVGNILADNGFGVRYHKLSDNRLSIVAEKGLSAKGLPIVFSGHIDVVPLGNKKWSVEPFSADIIDGKLFGRGSCDMKGGVAAIISAAVESFIEETPVGGIRLIITASEEDGLIGARTLVKDFDELGQASAIIIGEPTNNLPVIGHKSSLYMNVRTEGVTAHSSMPDKGVNAIYKAANAINKIEKYRFETENDTLLGFPTINVGKINGGLNVNSVPDFAEFTIDVRSTTKLTNKEVLRKLEDLLGAEVSIKPFVDTGAVFTSEENQFVKLVCEVTGVNLNKEGYKKSLPYTTDAAVLQPFYNNAPTIILGPGKPEMAHQTDEYCYVEKIKQAVDIYKEIISRWSKAIKEKD